MKIHRTKCRDTYTKFVPWILFCYFHGLIEIGHFCDVFFPTIVISMEILNGPYIQLTEHKWVTGVTDPPLEVTFIF